MMALALPILALYTTILALYTTNQHTLFFSHLVLFRLPNFG